MVLAASGIIETGPVVCPRCFGCQIVFRDREGSQVVLAPPGSPGMADLMRRWVDLVDDGDYTWEDCEACSP